MARMWRCAICYVNLCVVLLSTGCLGTGAPLGHDAIRGSDLYISESALSDIVDLQLSRADVIQQLGNPDVVNEETRSVGWERCIASKGYVSEWFFLPYRVTAIEVTDCQLSGIWFNEQDRAVAWDATRHNSAYGPMTTTLPQFLAVPGGSRR